MDVDAVVFKYAALWSESLNYEQDESGVVNF